MEVNISKREVAIEAFVESESNPGMYYKVTSIGTVWKCTCPAGVHRGNCKHIDAVGTEV